MSSASRSLALLRDHVSTRLGADGQDVWSDSILRLDSDGRPSASAFQIPIELLAPCGIASILDTANERNAKLKRQAEKAFGGDASFAPIAPRGGVSESAVAVLGVRWSWMFCYGADNEVDFSRGITWLGGRNSCGKTALLDVLTIGLYGSGIPSRSSENPTDFVNRMRPAQTTCDPSVSVVLCAADARRYQVHRRWTESGGKVTLACSVKDVTDPTAPVLVCKTATAVKDWVAKRVGSKEHFLRCCVLTQYNDMDFFGIDASKQIDLLMDDVDDDEVADKDAVQACADLLKSLQSGLNVVCKCVSAARDAIRSSSFDDGGGVESDVEQMRSDRTALENAMDELRVTLRDNKSVWSPLLRGLGLRDMPPARTVSDSIADLLQTQQSIASAAAAEKNDQEPKRQREDSVHLRSMKTELARLRSTYDSFPYNPDCSACRGVPFRVQMRKLQAAIAAETADELPAQPPASPSPEDRLRHVEDRLRLWRAIQAALPQYDEFLVAKDTYDKMKARDSELTLAIEKHKAAAEERARRSVLESVHAELHKRLDVLTRARRVLSGYRCHVFEHRILPQFVRHMNQVLECFPSTEGRELRVSASKQFVTPDDGDECSVFVPIWKISDGRVPLARGGGFERALVNCAARISLARMFHSERVRYDQIFLDESFSCSDSQNLSNLPAFLHALLQKFGYRAVIYACHDPPSLHRSHDDDDVATTTVRVTRRGYSDLSTIHRAQE